MNKQFIFLIAFAFIFIPMVSAVCTNDLGFKENNETIDLFQSCPSCSFVNVTSVQYPNGTLEPMNKAMTLTGITFTYQFNKTDQNGYHEYIVLGDKNGVNQVETFCFTITPNGKDNSKNSIIYLVILFVLIGLFVLSIWGFLAIDFKHERNEEGNIISISDIRYFKPVLMFVAYFILVWIMNIMVNITVIFDVPIPAKIFEIGFRIMLSLTYPLLIITIIIIVINYLRDAKLKKSIERGLE